MRKHNGERKLDELYAQSVRPNGVVYKQNAQSKILIYGKIAKITQTFMENLNFSVTNGRHAAANSAEKYLANVFYLHKRRYLGSKYKLAQWIFSIVEQECRGESFADIFAGTGAVASTAAHRYKHVVINDLLYSNQIIYHAFLGVGTFDIKK